MSRAICALLLAALPSSALAGTLANGSAPGIPWLRLLLSFGLCIGLAFGAIVLLKRYQQNGPTSPIRRLFERQGSVGPRRIAIVETRRASVHADICLVECDGETYLLALTPAGATVLDRREAEGKSE